MANYNSGTTLIPVIHENCLSPLEEMKRPNVYRRVFSYQLPAKHCFFIKADNSTDMIPAIQPNGLVLVKPLDITLPVDHKLIDKSHPRLLHHLELVAILVNGRIKFRQVLASVNGQHKPVNVYLFVHLSHYSKPDTDPIIPESDNHIRVIGKIIETINRY